MSAAPLIPQATKLEWIVDCVGQVWCVVAFAFLLTPLFIALIDPWVGLVTSIYCLFWLWRARTSWKIYKAARNAGKSREEWHQDEQAFERAATASARERLRKIMEE